MPQATINNYSSYRVITPSDSTPVTCRAIYVGGAGNLALSPDLTTAAVTFTAPPVGSIVPVELDEGRVMAATTATLLLALN
jgi:hypothetical protein